MRYVKLFRILDAEIVEVSAERLLEQFHIHHVHEVRVLNDSADDKAGGEFSQHI